jgi:hypothetical protein
MQSLIMWVQDEDPKNTEQYLQLKYDEFNLQDDIPVRDVKL